MDINVIRNDCLIWLLLAVSKIKRIFSEGFSDRRQRYDR
jgi:hypothetical protein